MEDLLRTKRSDGELAQLRLSILDAPPRTNFTQIESPAAHSALISSGYAQRSAHDWGEHGYEEVSTGPPPSTWSHAQGGSTLSGQGEPRCNSDMVSSTPPNMPKASAHIPRAAASHGSSIDAGSVRQHTAITQEAEFPYHPSNISASMLPFDPSKESFAQPASDNARSTCPPVASPPQRSVPSVSLYSDKQGVLSQKAQAKPPVKGPGGKRADIHVSQQPAAARHYHSDDSRSVPPIPIATVAPGSRKETDHSGVLRELAALTGQVGKRQPSVLDPRDLERTGPPEAQHDAHAPVSQTKSPEILRRSSAADASHCSAAQNLYGLTMQSTHDLYAHPVFQWTPNFLQAGPAGCEVPPEKPARNDELVINEPQLTNPLLGESAKDVVYDIASFVISDQAETAYDRFMTGIDYHLAYFESVGIKSSDVLLQASDDVAEKDDTESANGPRDNISGLKIAFDLNSTTQSSVDSGVFVKLAARPGSLSHSTQSSHLKIQFITDRHTARGTSLYFMDIDKKADAQEQQSDSYHLSRYDLDKTFVGDYQWIDRENIVLGDRDGFLHLLQWHVPPDIIESSDGGQQHRRHPPPSKQRINVQALAKLRAHHEGVREIAYNAEHKWTLSGANAGGLVISDVTVWDQIKGRVTTLPIPGKSGGVSSVRWHPSMQYTLSCATDDGLFTLYDARCSRDIAGFESPVSIYSHTYTSDNMVYLGHSNGTICGYDLRALRGHRQIKDSMVTSIGYLDYNKECNMLMSMGFGGVTAWQLSNKVVESASNVTPLRSMDLRDAGRLHSIKQMTSFTVSGEFVDQSPHFAAITSDGVFAWYDMLER